MVLGQFNPSTTFNTNSDVNPDNLTKLTLKAVWNINNSFFPSTLTTMQGMTSTICSAATTPAASATSLDTTGDYNGNTKYVPSKTLTDSRDSNTYTVRKLADGKCWMTSDLRLIGSKTLTRSDSNVSSSFTLPASISSWTSTYTEAMVAAYRGYYYYNYYAASAGTISGTSLTEASYSICPKGWRLPSNDEYVALFSAYSIGNNTAGSTKARSVPLNFNYSGEKNSSSTNYYGLGVNGYYWSATAYSSSVRYSTYLSSSSAFASYSSIARDYGLPVRCVAQ